MTFKTALQRNGAIRLASVSAAALLAVFTWSGAAEAQFGSKGPFSPYGGYPSKKYKDYYYDDQAPPKNDPGDMVPFKRSGVPIMAVVALDAQRVVIYDNAGKMFLQSPVSTGNTGYETPAGVFSVVQKKADHNSNLYEDGNMPFMQRITWTGIALHAGVLPGHPASHGCIRMPISFAQRLFEVTDVGMRVVIVPNEVVPAAIEAPKFFKATAPPVTVSGRPIAYGSPEHVQHMKSIAESKKSAADAAARYAKEARAAASKKAADAAAATKAVAAAEAAQVRAESLIESADKDLETAQASTAPNAAEAVTRAETAKQKAVARLDEVKAQLLAAKAQAEAKGNTAAAAEEDAKKAEAAADLASEATAEAERATMPVSVFISRKTQRLYVRQGYKPVYEGPVTIKDPDRPLGTYVFSAGAYTDNRPNWIMVSMYGSKSLETNVVRSSVRKGEVKRTESFAADVDGARSALDRITVSPQVMQQISSVVLPGSSLIISDEGASIETGKDTDFVVVMSGHPQGALKVRRKEPPTGWGSNKGWPPSGGFFFPKW